MSKKGCVLQTQKKYTSRNSPPYPANECCKEIHQGNDGCMYESRPDKNNVCRWYKQKGGQLKTKKELLDFAKSIGWCDAEPSDCKF